MQEAVKTWSTGAPDQLRAAVDKLATLLQPLRAVDAEMVRAYYYSQDIGGNSAQAAASAATNNIGTDAHLLRNRRKFNLLKFAIDSYCAMVVQVPAVEVSTVGEGWEQQQSAEALGLFIDGVFDSCKMRSLAWRCVVDSCLQRVAAVRVQVDNGKAVKVSRTLPHRIFWNPQSGDEPRELFSITPVPRSQALAMAKTEEDKKAIEKAPNSKPDDLFSGLNGVWTDVSDMVDLYEGFRTKGGGPDDPGFYCAQVGQAVVENPEFPNHVYPHEFHVLVPLRYNFDYEGFGGEPAADDLWSYQAELDDHANTIKEAMVKGAVNTWKIPRGAEIKQEELDNIQGRQLTYNPGFEPKQETGVTLPPEYFEREELLIRRCFDFLGLSYNAARGAKADGITSAKGQREVAALGQNRQILRMQTVQDWLVAIGKVIIGVADHAYEGKKDIAVTVPGGKLLRKVRWSEIKYNDQDFSIKSDAINALSRHPAARIEEILELTQAKIIDERQGLRQLNVKDLQSVRDNAFATDDLAEKLIALAMRGDVREPDPYMGEAGLTMLIERGKQRYMAELATNDPTPNPNTSSLRRLIEAAKAQLVKLQSGASANDNAPATGAPAPVPGDPSAPPDMAVPGAGLPNVPASAMPPPVPGQGLA